ncbi:hypothetical protein L596_006401 [Steinernema carpocapsae]|uniref:Uncharacterized protein n=1 Tax=Steinernema carpocapsae TaxID=34508 RepID=A0A4U8V461_STECR|nr:hypothetical protein L596_006401 [Steinernema carpocapsae]
MVNEGAASTPLHGYRRLADMQCMEAMKARDSSPLSHGRHATRLIHDWDTVGTSADSVICKSAALQRIRSKFFFAWSESLLFHKIRQCPQGTWVRTSTNLRSTDWTFE